MKTSTEDPVVLPPYQALSFPTRFSPEKSLKIRTMLVAADFSDESFRALDFALPLAKRLRASAHLVYVSERPPQIPLMVNRPELFSDPAVELFSEGEISHRLRDEMRRRFALELPAQDCHFRSGRAGTEICAVAQELGADLIVIGTHERTGLKHLTLGRTVATIVRHAPCPVLIVRQAARAPRQTVGETVLKKILVPVDFSECAREGARYAAMFAAQVGAGLRLLHVAYPANFTASDANVVPPEWEELVERARLQAEENLEKIVKSLPGGGILAESEVAVGTPIEKLVEATARPDIDMVITSTHGYTGLRHALLGSTAQNLVQLAHCPVLVVPSYRPEGRLSEGA